MNLSDVYNVASRGGSIEDMWSVSGWSGDPPTGEVLVCEDSGTTVPPDEPRVRPTREERDAQVFEEIEATLANPPEGIDYILPSPNVVTDGEKALAEREHVRVNDPRKKAPG